VLLDRAAIVRLHAILGEWMEITEAEEVTT
jgi:hypothetical protein